MDEFKAYEQDSVHAIKEWLGLDEEDSSSSDDYIENENNIRPERLGLGASVVKTKTDSEQDKLKEKLVGKQVKTSKENSVEIKEDEFDEMESRISVLSKSAPKRKRYDNICGEFIRNAQEIKEQKLKRTQKRNRKKRKTNKDNKK